ncbi:MAG: ATPase, T2SS/T4P/T4SS family [Chloroflexota bacterium]
MIIDQSTRPSLRDSLGVVGEQRQEAAHEHLGESRHQYGDGYMPLLREVWGLCADWERNRRLGDDKEAQDYVRSIVADVKIRARIARLGQNVDKFEADAIAWVCGNGYIDTCKNITDIQNLFIDGTRRAYYRAGTSKKIRDLPPVSDPEMFQELVQRALQGATPAMSDAVPLPPTNSLPGDHPLRISAAHARVTGEHCLAIRYLPPKALKAQDLIDRGLWHENASLFAHKIYAAGGSLLIVGATDAGKSTLAYSFSEMIQDERLIIIANPREIEHTNNYHVAMEVREGGAEGGKDVTVHDCVVKALTMSPDRLMLTEARGAEMLPLMKGLSTGHSGGLTTIHANSIPHALSVRIPGMVRGSEEGRGLSNSDIAASIADAFDLAIFIRKQALPDGSYRRIVTNIDLILDPVEAGDGRGMVVSTSPVYSLDERTNELVFSGSPQYPRKLAERARALGVKLVDDKKGETESEEGNVVWS